MSEKNITVIGVGYIGSITSVFLAENGYNVVGIDRNDNVLDKESWFSQHSDIAERVGKNLLESIRTSTNYDDIQGDISIVCVNTPSNSEGADLSNIKAAIKDLAKQIDDEHTIIIRSTLPPHTSRKTLIPLIEDNSDLSYGEDLHYCYAPEFLRGGSGFADLENPSKTVISGDQRGKEIFRRLFPVSENIHETNIETAEAVKCFDNVFHALKISLANESGRLGQELDFNANKVMNIISSDLKLNISDMYMNPGNAYGGPCLEKDIKIINNESVKSKTKTPVISSINESNRQHNSWLLEKILDKNPSTIGIIGATYKEGFNSLVNSPGLELASGLKQSGVDVLIYEPEVTINEFDQANIKDIKEKADAWVIFNTIDSIDQIKSDFAGDIIDLTEFSF